MSSQFFQALVWLILLLHPFGLGAAQDAAAALRLFRVAPGLKADLFAAEPMVQNVFFSSPGTDHEWQTWRRSLHDFVPRLFRD